MEKKEQPGVIVQMLTALGVTLLMAGALTLAYNDEGLSVSDFTGTADINFFSALGVLLILRGLVHEFASSYERGRASA